MNTDKLPEAAREQREALYWSVAYKLDPDERVEFAAGLNRVLQAAAQQERARLTTPAHELLNRLLEASGVYMNDAQYSRAVAVLEAATPQGLPVALAVECTCRVIEKCERCEAIDGVASHPPPTPEDR